MPYCENCGVVVSENDEACSECGKPTGFKSTSSNNDNPYGAPSSPQGQYQSGGSFGGHVENHLVKAILVTLCCCLPFGIVSIVHASSVNGKLAAGDYEGARIASEKANTWGNWGLGLGIVVNLISVAIQIAARS